jgi:hypothetical protein
MAYGSHIEGVGKLQRLKITHITGVKVSLGPSRAILEQKPWQFSCIPVYFRPTPHERAAGLVWCRLATPSALPTAAIQQALHAGIEHDRHALILPSPLPEWDSSHHLVVNVLLSLDPLEDKDYPVNPGRITPSFRRNLKNAGKEGDILTRFVGIPLDSGRRAIVALSVRSGVPPNAWTLAMSNRGRK